MPMGLEKEEKMKKYLTMAAVALIIFTGCTVHHKPVKVDKVEQNRQLVVAFENLDLEVKEIPRGVAIYFPEVLLFNFDSARMTFGARAKMRQIAAVVNVPQYRFRKISVEGHTDAVGSREYNRELSRRRAESVARELVFSGVSKERTTVREFGETKPLVPNKHLDGTDNPEGRMRNRRVELFIENIESEDLSLN
jgi:outer membrane protein OmpA-like peptidoglycan-associated protein